MAMHVIILSYIRNFKRKSGKMNFKEELVDYSIDPCEERHVFITLGSQYPSEITSHFYTMEITNTHEEALCLG
jgi:hypothetical protein